MGSLTGLSKVSGLYGNLEAPEDSESLHTLETHNPATLPGHLNQLQGMLRAFSAVSLLYVYFMFTVDVPMYFSNYMAQKNLSEDVKGWCALFVGFYDSLFCKVVTTAESDWAPHMSWMFWYFSACVWYSMLLPYYEPRRHEFFLMENPSMVGVLAQSNSSSTQQSNFKFTNFRVSNCTMNTSAAATASPLSPDTEPEAAMARS